MSKLDQIPALGRPQIGRMVERNETVRPVRERIAVAKEALRDEKPLNNVTHVTNNVTRKRGRQAQWGSAAERQRAYRERKKAKLSCSG